MPAVVPTCSRVGMRDVKYHAVAMAPCRGERHAPSASFAGT